jgi:hypothetical protein
MIEVGEILAILAKKRSIFHSEADFQHAFAWEIHHQLPDALIRLELPVQVKNEYLHIDVWVKNRDEVLAVELKYKTRGLTVEINGEHFRLTNQSAQDIGRYDFIKDIQRLEHIVSGQKIITGYAVLVTNDSAYWIKPLYHDTVDAKFRINNGRVLEGIFDWGPNASDGTKKSREQSLILQNKYDLQWVNFSRPSLSSYGEFRSLTIKVQ